MVGHSFLKGRTFLRNARSLRRHPLSVRDTVLGFTTRSGSTCPYRSLGTTSIHQDSPRLSKSKEFL